ncbi:DUF1236 domain-containing protein [Mesorhizobium sp. BAC0120]|uniref:DUF1236 domain-containing protein n=1 Tax=Mesorhizobium sp. BAC0120 TaxID=3090670 RepID=UPI00298D1B15|nr:DUF1236 domain-containing protein [Mesorhizobium sp. BAC0120]MDW6026394.1 DUF1236 domain-containing protein [Mesorhizobium sp. BAC0120]
MMKKPIVSTLTATLLLAGIGVAAADTVVVSPDEETAIREYVTTEKVTPVEPPAGVDITVGATLPDTVELHTLSVPKVKHKYEYVVIGKKTVLVEPSTRKIVHVIGG